MRGTQARSAICGIEPDELGFSRRNPSATYTVQPIVCIAGVNQGFQCKRVKCRES